VRAEGNFWVLCVCVLKGQQQQQQQHPHNFADDSKSSSSLVEMNLSHFTTTRPTTKPR
jgi:hypothetical protein